MDIVAEIRYKAMDFLARREHSRKELREKLRKRYDDHILIDEVVDTLVLEGLQSDKRYVESFLRQRVAAGYGPLRLRAELRQRGISENEISLGLSELSGDWLALAETAWQKKFGVAAVDAREKAKQQRFLAYRGFSNETIQELLS
jgi:regulatory protein